MFSSLNSRILNASAAFRKFGIGLVANVLLAGALSSAAYKKWEKAAIAGVSLVADAAEHLERAITDKEVEQDRSAAGESFPCQFLVIFS